MMDWLHLTLQGKIASLDRELAEAQERILSLEADILSITSPEEEAYRKVGLSSGCSPVVVTAARKALLSHWHPDRWPEGRKRHATQRFQAAQAAFERIAVLRESGRMRG
ncbi:hypothetical protein ACFOYU_13110 [Microvirga sp. GCM10011540]|uniref:hypothetical protein n=1 Tax=Microvirga sp. GCM10011540 TaxID=3317338 RepID=UPI00360719A4